MAMARRHFLLLLAVASPLSCNEGRVDGDEMVPGLAGGADVSLQQLAEVVDDASVDLSRAIAAAEAATRGTAIEAKVALRGDSDAVYEVEVLADERIHELVLDLDSLAVQSREDDVGDAEDSVDADLAARADWAALVAAAEAETGGDAFEIEADGENGSFEVEVLADGGVWDVVVNPDGSIQRSTRDDGEWDDDQAVS